jgi:hypothetical protein
MAGVPATLRLRAEEAPTDTREETSASRRIRWSEDVVDNEGMGKKSSKGTSKLYASPLKQLISLTALSMLHLPQSPAGRREQLGIRLRFQLLRLRQRH